LCFVSFSTARIELIFIQTYFALLCITLNAYSKSVHNTSTGVQNEIFWSGNTQTISSSTSLTLMAWSLYKNKVCQPFWCKVYC